MHKGARAGVLAATAGTAVAAYAAYRAGGRRWRADEEELMVAGASLPGDLEHHFLPTDDGGRLHVVERGAGPPVVLVHGLALSAAVWAHQLRQLSCDHRVIAVDLRGHGQSLPGPGGYSMDRLAQDLLVVLEALDVRRGVLVGHSLGGMVCQHLAATRAQAVGAHMSSLALLATSAGPVAPGAPRLSSAVRAAMHRADRLGAGLLPRGDVATWIARGCFGTHPMVADIELTRSLLVAISPEALAEAVATTMAFCDRPLLGAIEVPTTVVVGSADVLTPPRMARVLARGIPGATLEELPGAGHMVMLERAQEVNAAVHHLSGFALALTA